MKYTLAPEEVLKVRRQKLTQLVRDRVRFFREDLTKDDFNFILEVLDGEEVEPGGLDRLSEALESSQYALDEMTADLEFLKARALKTYQRLDDTLPAHKQNLEDVVNLLEKSRDSKDPTLRGACLEMAIRQLDDARKAVTALIRGVDLDRAHNTEANNDRQDDEADNPTDPPGSGGLGCVRQLRP